MNYLFQFFILVAISFIGEAFAAFLPFPIPTNIYALLVLLVGLLTGIVPLERVRDTGKFLLPILPVMFTASAAGMVEYPQKMLELAIPIVLIVVVSTGIVMAVTGWSAQAMIRRKGGKK